MSVSFHVIIPARYESTRLPGKLMLELNGQTVLERAYRQALQAKPRSVVIATDNEKLYAHAKTFGATVEMTAVNHPSGTDRIAEVVERKGFKPEDIIVNLQG